MAHSSHSDNPDQVNPIEPPTTEEALRKRAVELQVVAEVSTAAATILNSEKLLQTVVTLTRERFDLSHVHIGLINEAGDQLQMVASGDPIGQKIMANSPIIDLIHDRSLATLAVTTRQSVIVNNVNRDPNYLSHPLLDKVQAEMVVPMIVGERLIGVLAVQSNHRNRFTDEDISIQQTLAAQIAVALENARRFEKIKQISAETEEARNFLDSIIENVPNPLYVKSAEDLSFIHWNSASEKLTGFKREDVIGKTDYETSPKEVADHYSKADRKALTSGQQLDLSEVTIRNTVGDLRTLHTRKIPISGPDGHPKYLLGISEDITERKRAEEALRTYAEELEETIKQLQNAQEKITRQEKLSVLGQLAGSVGHELRNPLGVISNAVYFLKTILAETDDLTTEYLERIADHVQEADKIVDDLLDLSRTRAAERQAVNVADLITDVLQRSPSPEEISVNTTVSDDLPFIQVDPQQIRQVLTNLVNNAYQAMASGGSLAITAQFKAGQMILSLTDTGHGMDSDTLDQIFEPLFTTKPKGFGLGLVVSKNLIGLNQGAIEVTSAVGEGTTFTLTLPTQDSGRGRSGI